MDTIKLVFRKTRVFPVIRKCTTLCTFLHLLNDRYDFLAGCFGKSRFASRVGRVLQCLLGTSLQYFSFKFLKRNSSSFDSIFTFFAGKNPYCHFLFHALLN